MKEQNCELCELHELCKEYLRPSPYQVITCEAFKAAIRDYGGVDKLYKDLYDALKQAIKTEEKQGQFSLEYCSDFLNTMMNNTEN